LKTPGLLVAILAGPIVAAAIVVFAVQAVEIAGGAWWEDTRPRNAAEAATAGRAAELVRLIRRGDHPEQLFPVRGELVQGAPAWLSAVEGAMWGDGPAVIRLLEREGAVLTDTGRRALACLARDLGRSATADYLLRDGPAACAPGRALAAVNARSGP
jgi:hypothetical protein